MSRESDRIGDKVACLAAADIPFTLVSTAGFHCTVWRSIGVIVRDGIASPQDFVLKCCKRPYRVPEVEAMHQEYRQLKDELEDIVPDARFVATSVNDRPGMVVLAENCTPWFDLSNPGNEDEALPLIRRRPKARAQLARFTLAARRWLERDSQVVDLCGTENLILDRNYDVRFLDSFHVFFYLDTLHVIDEVDDALEFRLETSIKRLVYLERLVASLS